MRLRSQSKSAPSLGNLLMSKAAPQTGVEPQHAHQATYSFDTMTLADAVDRCVNGRWDMPDFQRGFVWKPAQSALLADSLWRNYPIGFVLLCTASDDSSAPNSGS